VNTERCVDFNQEQVVNIPRQRFVLPKSQRKSYRNILGGIYKAKKTDEQVKFVSFTTSDECANQESFTTNTLSDDFKLLTRQIKRLTPSKLVDDGYISKRQSGQYYGADNYEVKVFSDMAYFKVHTSEGNGVIHSLMRAPFIPYDYIVDLWTDLHLTWSINIQNLDLNNYSAQDCAGYIVAQYIGVNQGTSYLYSSQSKNWLFPGANKLWEDLKKTYLKDADDYIQYSIKTKQNQNKTISFWTHPYHKEEELSIHFDQLKIEWEHAIDESIQVPDFTYPAKKQNVNDLTPTELQTLELDVLNTLYIDSRINPRVAMNKHKPNKYYEYVEKRLDKKHIPRPTQEDLDQFYKVGDYINKGDNYE